MYKTCQMYFSVVFTFQEELVKEMIEKQLPRVLGHIEKTLEKTGTGYVVGNDVSTDLLDII